MSAACASQMANVHLWCTRARLQAPPPRAVSHFLFLAHVQLFYSREAPGRGRFLLHGWFLFPGMLLYRFCVWQGKWSESSLLEKRLSEDSSCHLRLQKWASMWSADALGLELRWRREEAASAENPLVFLCALCRRPLGDSLTWVTGLEDTNCILLHSQCGTVLPAWGIPRCCPGLK